MTQKESQDFIGFNTASGKRRCNNSITQNKNLSLKPVSIPQAVSAVATSLIEGHIYFHIKVSIPQAVSAVATAGSRKPVFKRFQKVVLENLKP